MRWTNLWIDSREKWWGERIMCNLSQVCLNSFCVCVWVTLSFTPFQIAHSSHFHCSSPCALCPLPKPEEICPDRWLLLTDDTLLIRMRERERRKDVPPLFAVSNKRVKWERDSSQSINPVTGLLSLPWLCTSPSPFLSMLPFLSLHFHLCFP